MGKGSSQHLMMTRDLRTTERGCRFHYFEIDGANTGCPEIFVFNSKNMTGADLDTATAKSWRFRSANDATTYRVWYDVTDGGANADPSGAETGIEVDVLLADTATEIATKTKTAIDATAGADTNTLALNADRLEVTLADPGPATDADDIDSGALLSVTQQGADDSTCGLNEGSPHMTVEETGSGVYVLTLNKPGERILFAKAEAKDATVPEFAQIEYMSSSQVRIRHFDLAGSDIADDVVWGYMCVSAVSDET